MKKEMIIPMIFHRYVTIFIGLYVIGVVAVSVSVLGVILIIIGAAMLLLPIIYDDFMDDLYDKIMVRCYGYFICNYYMLGLCDGNATIGYYSFTKTPIKSRCCCCEPHIYGFTCESKDRYYDCPDDAVCITIGDKNVGL